MEEPDDPIELFYGGAAGGGKSDWLLMAALEYVDVPDYAALILRRTYTQLAKPGALIPRSKAWLSQTDARWNEQEKTWHFPSGAALAFGYLEHPDDEEQYQSAEFQFVGFDELTHFPERNYLYLFSRLRRLEGSEVPLRMCAASNPGRRGHGWVRDRLVEGKARNRVFIPAKIEDNPHLDERAYRASLAHLSPTLRMQLELGVWNAFEGLAYPRFSPDVHVVPANFRIPGWWDRFEGFDHGSSNPAAWLSFAADGDGNYLAHAGYYSPGLVSAHAEEIKRRRVGSMGRTQTGELVPSTIYGDPSIKGRMGITDWRGREVTLELEYADHGLVFAPGQNDRRAGYIRIAELLRPIEHRYFPPWHPRRGEQGAPRLYVLDIPELEPLRQQFRDAPLEDPDSPVSRWPGEAVDFEWESSQGHAHAAARYALMSRQPRAEQPEHIAHPLARTVRDQLRRKVRAQRYEIP